MKAGRKIRFLFAGGIGFAVDAAVLAALTRIAGIDPFTSRIAAILFALTVTWQINRHVTFGPGRHGRAVEAARYGGVGLTGSAVNYLIYAALLALLPGLDPVIALAVASMAVTVLSWFGYSRLVFDPAQRPKAADR